MERLPSDTEMFAPNVTCVVVLNHVLKLELWPFKHPRDISSKAYFSLRMMKIRSRYYSPATKSTQSQPLLKSVPSSDAS